MDLEDEIRSELERLEQIFNEESQLETTAHNSRSKPDRLSYSAYEYAEAEGEKEELEDKFKQLVSRSEDWTAQIEYISGLNSQLQQRNLQLLAENQKLRERLGTIEPVPGNDVVSPLTPETEAKHCSTAEQEPVYECYGSISQGSIALELLLAETRAKLQRAEAAYQDMAQIKDAALQELESERALRIHAEKERDAFSAAYEASLEHFERWTRVPSTTTPSKT